MRCNVCDHEFVAGDNAVAEQDVIIRQEEGEAIHYEPESGAHTLRCEDCYPDVSELLQGKL